MVGKISSYNLFSTLDLRSAYHQIPMADHEKKYTAFEANKRLYQFRRIPFGVTNGVSCFQRTIDSIITREKLKDTFVYVDNITICGKTQEDHDHNLNNLINVAKKVQLDIQRF